jgi:hypothetical protein
MKTRTWIASAGLSLLAALASDASRVAAGQLEGQAGTDEKIVVRKLKFEPNPKVIFMIAGKSKLWALEDAAAVEKLVGTPPKRSTILFAAPASIVYVYSKRKRCEESP